MEVNRKIDCLGLLCPMPILKTREALGTMAIGELLEVVSDDPGVEADMRSWSTRAGHEILEVGRDGTVFRFVVRKTR